MVMDWRKFFLKKWITILLVLGVSLLGAGAFYGDAFRGRAFLKPSKAKIFIRDEKIVLDFELKNKDLEKILEIENKLEIEDGWRKGILLEVDDQALGVLEKVLPVDLNINFSESEIFFSSAYFNTLKSAVAGERFEIATGSGELRVSSNGANDYFISIVDPAQVLKYATVSGNLRVSQTFSLLFPILQKVDKIELRIKNNEARGEIRLK